MRSPKHLLALILCVLIVGSGATAFGQKLGQSDVNKLIAFYEWALEAEFTPEQRERFQFYVDANIKQRGKSARDNLMSLVGSWEQIQTKSEEFRRNMRSDFLKEFLPQLQRSTDEDDAFLLGIYNAAHSGRTPGSKGTVAKSESNEQASATSPASVIGRWERYTGSGSITDGTGKTKYGNGKTFSFEFGPAGSVVYTVVEKTLSIMGCRIESTDQSTGKFALSGNSMTITLAAGTSVGTDSCTKAGNYRKVQPASQLTVNFQVKQSDSVFRPDKPILLCFDGGDGEACYEKVPKPQGSTF